MGKIGSKEDQNSAGKISNPIASCPISETHDEITWAPKGSTSPAVMPVAFVMGQISLVMTAFLLDP